MSFELAANLLNNTNVRSAADIAAKTFGGNQDDKNLFSNIMSSVVGGKTIGTSQTLPEPAEANDVSFAKKAWDKIYGNNQTSSSPQDLGSAAALQAFKLFTGGGGNQAESTSPTEKVAGLALSEGMKLFQNNNAGATQSDILRTAVQWALKFFMSYKLGNSNSGFNALLDLTGDSNNNLSGSTDGNKTTMADDGASGLIGKILGGFTKK